MRAQTLSIGVETSF